MARVGQLQEAHSASTSGNSSLQTSGGSAGLPEPPPARAHQRMPGVAPLTTTPSGRPLQDHLVERQSLAGSESTPHSARLSTCEAGASTDRGDGASSPAGGVRDRQPQDCGTRQDPQDCTATIVEVLDLLQAVRAQAPSQASVHGNKGLLLQLCEPPLEIWEPGLDSEKLQALHSHLSGCVT